MSHSHLDLRNFMVSTLRLESIKLKPLSNKKPTTFDPTRRGCGSACTLYKITFQCSQEAASFRVGSYHSQNEVFTRSSIYSIPLLQFEA